MNPTPEPIDHRQIEALAAVLRDAPRLTEIDICAGTTRLRLRRPARPLPRPAPLPLLPPAAPPPVPAAAAPEIAVVVALVVGVFRSLDAPETVEPGDRVEEGQPLGQIETMRILNDCVADAAGRIRTVLVENGQPVEYGQPLFEIEPEENTP